MRPFKNKKNWCFDNFSGVKYKSHRKTWNIVFRAMLSMFLCGSTQNLSDHQKIKQNASIFDNIWFVMRFF